MSALEREIKERRRDAWYAEAIAEARENPAFCDEVAMLESEILRRKNLQREIMADAIRERRTLFPPEARGFDLQQSYLDAAESKLNAVLHRVRPR